MVSPVNVLLHSRAVGDLYGVFIYLTGGIRLCVMFGALLQNPATLGGVHPHCLLFLMPKEFLARPVLGFVRPCNIPMLNYLRCISAAPPGMLEFIDIGGNLSLKNHLSQDLEQSKRYLLH